MGSKAKITKYIVPIIQRKIDESGARYYVEPFAGGCNVIDKIKAEYRIASDSNKYLIALFQHLQDGGELPEHITREEYNKAREAYRTGDNSLQAWYIGAVEKKLTAKERRERNFYDAQYMIYYELPVLISKIFHAAFANCECGTPVIEKEDMQFIEGFVKATEDTFNIAMEGQKKQIAEMLKMHE